MISNQTTVIKLGDSSQKVSFSITPGGQTAMKWNQVHSDGEASETPVDHMPPRPSTAPVRLQHGSSRADLRVKHGPEEEEMKAATWNRALPIFKQAISRTNCQRVPHKAVEKDREREREREEAQLPVVTVIHGHQVVSAVYPIFFPSCQIMFLPL